MTRSRNLSNRASDSVSVKDFGAVGDGVTDDSTAFATAANYCIANGRTLLIPAGNTFRIVTGYTFSQTFAFLKLQGENKTKYTGTTQLGSVIKLDSSSPTSFFLKLTGNNSYLQCEGLTFLCAQFVQDRAFFDLSSPLQNHSFVNCYFLSVERPVVYRSTTYFQSAVFRDVMWDASGTIHSEGAASAGSLIGSFLMIQNCNHENNVPVNTAAIVCDLRDIRFIAADSLLLEGTLPASGWTALNLQDAFNSSYTKSNDGIFNQFYSEWSSNPPTYTVAQSGGTFTFKGVSGISITSKYSLSNHGNVIIENTTFADTLDPIPGLFVLADSTCGVTLQNCGARVPSYGSPGINHLNTTFLQSTATNPEVTLSNNAPQLLAKWTGGFNAADGITQSQFNCTPTISTDATYGRNQTIAVTGAGFSTSFSIPCHGMVNAGDTVTLVLLFQTPVMSSGSVNWQIRPDSVTVSNNLFTASNTLVSAVLPWTLASAPTNMLFTLADNYNTGTGTILIYGFAVYIGNSIPRSVLAQYAPTITTSAAAVPSTGTWARGDRCFNSTPTVGSPKSWVCTVSGSPGTWVSEGNL